MANVIVCDGCGVSFNKKPSKVVKVNYCTITCKSTNGVRIRFWNNVVKTESCWLWIGYKNDKGYGVASKYGSELILAHRFSFEMTGAVIPDGMSVCHNCDVRNCVNPDHLFLGTHQENMDDMNVKGRHGSRKLTDEDVNTIRHECMNGATQTSIAKRYGVTQSIISDIMRCVSYRHVKE